MLDLSRKEYFVGSTYNIHVHASLRQLCHTNKIVNALELRQQGNHLPPRQLATDMVALSALHPPPEHFTSAYPLHDMTFALAAQNYARHREHFDRSGFVTDILVHCGQKWWLIGIPESGEIDCEHASEYGIDFFNRNAGRQYQWYGLLLLPGMRL